MSSSLYRLRFAPSPTGALHVGGARTALFNYLFARATGGKFILRIEDTDRQRSTDEAIAQMLRSLHWLGIEWDEGPKTNFSPSGELQMEEDSLGEHGPYLQSRRLDTYNKQIVSLLETGKAFPCTCSDEELELERKRASSLGKPYVYSGKCRQVSKAQIQKAIDGQLKGTVRFLVPKDAGELVFTDLVKGEVRFDSALIGDFIIRKSDGFPTYNFAAVCDDSAMGITHVLRGDDHISNTPRQLLIYKALEKPPPVFAHVAMILSEEREKLSKRVGGQSVTDYETLGYYPDPMINHLALLGWSPKDGVEVIDRQRLKRAFGDMKFSAAPAVFHQDKLDYLNGLYIRNLDKERYLKDAKSFLSNCHLPKKRGILAQVFANAEQMVDATQIEKWLAYEKIDQLLLLLRNYLKKLADLLPHLSHFFSPPPLNQSTEPWVQSKESQTVIALALEHFNQRSEAFISLDELTAAQQKAKEKLQLKGKKFFMPLRVSWTGLADGLELTDIVGLISRAELIGRMRFAIGKDNGRERQKN